MTLVSGARARITAVPVLAVFIAVFAWGIAPLLFLAPSISINSPGGSPVQSHLIYSYIRQLADKKKIKVLILQKMLLHLAVI